ncbi:hypothetical protein N9224_01330 [Akkermansiaceae bacterium]|nr:hypothetical protein [Akkermansiaceae bacterium]
MIILRTTDLALIAGILCLVFALQKNEPEETLSPQPITPASFEPIEAINPPAEVESPITSWF